MAIIMKLIGLLLLGLASVVEGEVVKHFSSSCPEFFIKNQNNNPVIPTVPLPSDVSRYKQICQKYTSKRGSAQPHWVPVKGTCTSNEKECTPVDELLSFLSELDQNYNPVTPIALLHDIPNDQFCQKYNSKRSSAKAQGILIKETLSNNKKECVAEKELSRSSWSRSCTRPLWLMSRETCCTNEKDCVTEEVAWLPANLKTDLENDALNHVRERDARYANEKMTRKDFEVYVRYGAHTDTDKSNKLTGYRYATLYDTHYRIPVYSAYLYTGYAPTKRTTSWMIEPQLDGFSQEEMTREEDAGGRVGLKQAVNKDFTNTGYEKGHLYPRCQNCDQDQAESTFTLTNAAPQTAQDNKRWYNQVEKKIAQRMLEKCSERTAHVVTGVVPGNRNLLQDDLSIFFDFGHPGFNIDRVRVASHFWSAFCCKDRYNQNRLISEGYILEMKGDGSAEAVYQTLNNLNRDLAIKYISSSFQVFGSIQGCS
ncbi:uncharacterized protein LOC134070036 [Sardina pilchardus]|uniref:uncharacterized protein LOC134070036 n=1 Tax=Sardina pilchardus TaxID=27697 RepID=UPI002E11C3F6